MLDPALDLFPCEVYVRDIQAVLATWSSTLCVSPRILDALRLNLSTEIRAFSFSPSHIQPIRTNGPIRIEKREFSPPVSIRAGQFLSEFAASLQSWSAMETADFEIYGIREAQHSPLVVDTDIRFNLVGTVGPAVREQREGSWHVSWVQSTVPGGTAGAWYVREWRADTELRTQLTGPGFTEITEHCLDRDTPAMAQLLPGIDEWRSAMDGASGIDVYGNHGIAVGDIDGSGFDSFYVCQPSGLPNRLFRNRGDGTFQDITETSGTGIVDGTASALFADFSNRGMQDLLVVRTGGPLLFVNRGDGRFEPRPDAFHFARPPQGTFTSAAVADYNRDGFLDVYLCVYSFYQGLNQYQFPSPYYDAQNGPPNFLFRNHGNGTFEDVTLSSGMDENNNRFSFAAAWCDYDNDGWPDLYVANDFGRKNLYRNKGDGAFADVASRTGVEDYGPGMSTCWLDLDNDGLQDVYVANMWLPEGQRITADEHFLPGVDHAIRRLYQKHNAGNSMYRNNGKGSFEDRTSAAGTSKCGWSWSCASWDFDNDGWSDIYVANGFVSGPNHFDLQSFFWRQVAQRSMTPSVASSEYELAWNAVNELVRSDFSWSGYQRNVLFVNNGGAFSDVAGVLGMDLRDDCRAYSLSDIDHDGRLELVIKNRTGPQVRVLRNDLEGIGHSIALRLVGQISNRDAVGAIVTIERGATRQTKFVSIGSGFASQHTKELFFGLGEATGPIAISVRWPSGTVSHYNNLRVNCRFQIDENGPEVKATPYKTAPSIRHATPTAVAKPAATQSLNTWLVAPLFGPDLQLADLAGQKRQLSALRGRPVLLVFTRPGCGGSRDQLDELQQSFEKLQNAGLFLFVVALSFGSDRAAIEELAHSAAGKFPVHVADEREAGAWNIQYRYLFDRRRDMSLPTAFLIGKDGAILRVYQGIVAAQMATHDWANAPTTPSEQFARAMPFNGPYHGGEMKHNYLTFGLAFAEFGYQEEAQAAFERATQADPNLEFAWFNLGTIYLARKMYPEARKALKEAVRINPQDSDAWNNLGIISGNEEHYDEALEQFESAAMANPNNSLAVENMMRIYQFQGKAVEAQKTLQELISLAPENSDLHLGLAMALVAQNDLQRAREELETAVRLRPTNSDAINNLGAVLLRMGRANEALDRFEESRRIAPDFDRASINAAMVYNSIGQSAKARRVLEEFLSRHPDNPDVRGALNKMEKP